MARIRSIHPKLWTDEEFVSVSPLARLLLIGLLNESDDGGAFEWKPLTIKMRLLPADDVDVPSLLNELVAAGKIVPYTAEGKRYGAIRNFGKFQRPKKPNRVYPMPSEMREVAATQSIGVETEPTDPLSAFAASILVDNQFPTGGGISPQREEGEDSKEEERSDPSDQAPSPPKQSSFLPEPEKPKSPYEIARGDLLPLLAEMAGYADDANGRMKAGKLFNQIYGQIDKDLDGLREIVTRIHAKAETRDKGIACIKAEIESRKNTVRLVVDNEKPDPWGINAWCIAQGATPTQSAKEKSIGKWALHGRIVDSTAKNVAKAAMLPASWRGDWSALAGWVKDKIPTDQIIVAINRRCENPSYDPSMIRSIRFFDDNVRGGRKAA